MVTFLPDADGYAINTSGFPPIVFAPSPMATHDVCAGNAIEKNRSDDVSLGIFRPKARFLGGETKMDDDTAVVVRGNAVMC